MSGRWVSCPDCDGPVQCDTCCSSGALEEPFRPEPLDVRDLTFAEVVNRMPEEDREVFYEWWSTHPTFSHQFDWQKLVAEAFKAGAAFGRGRE